MTESTDPINDYFPDALPSFEPGQLIRHRRYHYRGVVVDFDMRCQANGDWYYSNRTQPDQDQPWYHVLVDSSTATTYAAESSLEADELQETVEHPLIEHFFDSFDNGTYHRNDRPWPAWS